VAEAQKSQRTNRGDVLSRREMNELLIAAQESPEAAAKILAAAANVRRPNGASKARDYLDRMRDLDDEMTPPIARVLVGVLSAVGDALLSEQDEEIQGPFSLPNRWRILCVINHLLKHAEAADRLPLIRSVIAQGHSIALAGDAPVTTHLVRNTMRIRVSATALRSESD
jgi:hypothetical protein